MIVDSHAYCFEPADSPRGYANSTEHLRIVQQAHARHHQPAFRLGDRQEGPSDVLDTQGKGSLDDLPNLDFRIDKAAGRVLWDYRGDTYTKHFYPPNLRNLEFTPHSLIAEMDYAHIDKVLLHTNSMLGRSNQYQAECVLQYPDRILSMAQIDERRIHTDVDAVIDEATEAVHGLGLGALKFGSQGYTVSPEPWDRGAYTPFWDAISTLGVPVFFTLSTGPRRASEAAPDPEQQRGYLDELRILSKLMLRYPKMLCSITHGFPWRVYLDGGRIRLPDAIWEPFENPNLSIEVCFPVRVGDIFDYPYEEVWPVMADMVERIGPDRLLYGTDMPFQNRFCTYRQSRHWIERRFAPSTGLPPDDLARIMGGAAARVLGIRG